MGLSQSEVDEVTAHCQAAHADCVRQNAERALPQRVVTVSPFLMYRAEVTNQDFAAWLNLMRGWLTVEKRDDSLLVIHDGVVLIDIMPRYSGIEQRMGRFVARRGRERKPVGKVTWDGALAYCKSKGHRLPTEAEWELAAGGTERRRFPWGNQDPRCADVMLGRNPGQPCHGYPHDVGDVAAAVQDVTPERVHDLGGNVAEWVMDRFVEPYPVWGSGGRDSSVPNGSAGNGLAMRVVRGASSYNFPVWARSAMRSRWFQGSMPQADIGFRCAMSVAE
jgi:formylglycine-generating enzyme required for sulfatase activity